MIQSGQFKVYFKHSTINALEQKGLSTIVVNGKVQPMFTLPYEEWSEYNFLMAKNLNGRTWCFIESNGAIVAKAVAECKEEDIFSKEKGCYASLKNATKEFPYSTRKMLFKSFSNRKPNLSDKVLVKGEYYDEDLVFDLINTHGEVSHI